jgi:hypothetical protein
MIKVWVVYVLLANSSGGMEYWAMDATRDRKLCFEVAMEIAKFAMQHPKSAILGARCAESKA